MGTLYVVATPIGNLKDITLRALEVLKVADVVYAEDTRVTMKLLSHYGISVKVFHYDEHAPTRTAEDVVRRLRAGEQVVLVSDAGTPGISDPGAVLVAEVGRALPGVSIIAVPGASAVIAALSVSGLAANKFTFVGYPPVKNKRKKFFDDVARITVRPVVLYESPHRLQRTLDDLKDAMGDMTDIFVAKELTKIHETNFRGTVAEAKEYFTGDMSRGEFVLILP